MTSLSRGAPRNHAEIVKSVVTSSAALGRAGFAASWRRSLVYHKLDPGQGGGIERLSSAEVRARREASGLLLRIAEPVLDRLARAACDSGCTVLLSDAGGFILDERVRAGDKRDFHASNLAPGSDWSEGAEGTNGIGTCLAEGRAVTVWRDQHFRATNTGLTCTGAPVFGAEGELAGVIDISSARADMTEGYARLVALTVQDAASRIEADLFRASFEGARILSTGGASAVESGPAGVMLLALNRDDLVIGATRAARKALNINADQIGHLPADDLFHPGREAAPGGGLEEAQRAEMVRALARARGNVSAAARDLGIGRATFYRKAKALGVAV